MPAPVATIRTAPTVAPEVEGHSTVINFVPYDPLGVFAALFGGVSPLVSFWEKAVTPPGLDGGAPVQVETMWNLVWMTVRPRALQSMTEMSGQAAYSPAILPNATVLINLEGTFTVIHPDGEGWAFFGYFRVLKPNENKQGEQPTLQFTVQPTNVDPSDGSEQGPIRVAVVV